jgi:hypothetical protein
MVVKGEGKEENFFKNKLFTEPLAAPPSFQKRNKSSHDRSELPFGMSSVTNVVSLPKVLSFFQEICGLHPSPEGNP